MITASRRIQFSYGHRVWKHESKCKHFHGHNGVVWLYARAMETQPELDSLGRVIDFGVLKEKIGNWVDKNWDHGFIYNLQDKETERVLLSMPGQKMFGLNANPTAEIMASHLLTVVCPMLLEDTGVEVFKVTFYETENCFAEVTLDIQKLLWSR